MGLLMMTSPVGDSPLDSEPLNLTEASRPQGDELRSSPQATMLDKIKAVLRQQIVYGSIYSVADALVIGLLLLLVRC